jgi:hypothetical protein
MYVTISLISGQPGGKEQFTVVGSMNRGFCMVAVLGAVRSSSGTTHAQQLTCNVLNLYESSVGQQRPSKRN